MAVNPPGGIFGREKWRKKRAVVLNGTQVLSNRIGICAESKAHRVSGKNCFLSLCLFYFVL